MSTTLEQDLRLLQLHEAAVLRRQQRELERLALEQELAADALLQEEAQAQYVTQFALAAGSSNSSLDGTEPGASMSAAVAQFTEEQAPTR
jgi:hypothetical protein